WRDEVRQRRIEAAFALLELLAQRVQDCNPLAPRVVGIEHDVVALGVRRPEADRRPRSEPLLLDDEIEHLAGIVIERARGLADLGIIEDRRETPGQFPGLEERRPVDGLDELREIVLVKTL